MNFFLTAFQSLALAIVLLPAIATAKEPFDATAESLSEYLSMGSGAMTCVAVGNAVMAVAMTSHKMDAPAGQDVDSVIDNIQDLLEIDPATPTSIGELATLAALTYVIQNPAIVANTLEATAGSENMVKARISSHRAVISPCFATFNLKTTSGFISRSDAKNGILELYKSTER